MKRAARIAVDCRPLQNRYAQRGIGTVTRNLLSHLVKSRCSTSLVLCGSSPQPPLRCGAYRMLRRGSGRDWLQEQLRWPADLMRLKADIFHATVSLGLIREIGFPLLCPAKSIATVHDLTPLHLPGLARHTRMLSYLLQRSAVRRAGRVVTVSSFVKNDLVARLGIRENRIRVLPLAVDEAVAKCFDSRPCASAPPERYLLGLGEEENKNIIAVVKTFSALAAGGFAGGLRIVGTLENQNAEVRQAVSGALRERIAFTGAVTTEQLVENYATCALFLFPSRSEGFGLPVIEAMYCGAPVLCSNSTSLPEAGGDAAVYCDPDDVQGMAAAAAGILQNAGRRQELVERGRRRARRTGWADAAEAVIAIYEELGATFQ